MTLMLALLLSITVAILDTGIDASHAHFASTVVASWDVDTLSTDAADTCDHDTGVASIVVDKAPDAALLAIDVFGDNCMTNHDRLAEGVLYAIEQGVDVIMINTTMIYTATSLQDAIAAAQAADIDVLASAGNQSSSAPHYPAAYEGVIAVGGLAYPLGNTGEWVDVYTFAKGIRVASAGGGYAYRNGTSYAAPRVAGILARYRAEYPDGGDILSLVAEATVDSYLPTVATGR